MRLKALLVSLFIGCMSVQAQTDPVVMTIGGHPITKSEFEYSYNKNNIPSAFEHKSVKEYVDLFVNYKLKVLAALDARLDTLESFKNEFESYRNQEIRPTFVDDSDIENKAKQIYRQAREEAVANGGLVHPMHILLMMRQTDTKGRMEKVKQKVDSIYQQLLSGADFSELARRFSDDKKSAKNGGLLPWIQKGQTLKEFDDVVFSMKPGEMSKPFRSPAGWHIVLLKEKQDYLPYDSLHEEIVRFIKQRGLREQIIEKNLDSISRSQHIAKKELLDERCKKMTEQNPELKNLLKEYYEGLLLFEISNREVWEKAKADKLALDAYFKKNKKKYHWERPRFKGIVYHVKTKDDAKAIKKLLKKVPFENWADTLRTTFNGDSIMRMRAEKGYFVKGKNPIVDMMVFKVENPSETVRYKDFPIDGIYGKLLKQPKSREDVATLVVNDYQEELEKQWLEKLRKKYPVVINEDVLKTLSGN